MNLPQENKDSLYQTWQSIEKYVLPWTRDAFVRFYLEAKQSKEPDNLYYDFKKFRASCGMDAVQLLQDMQRYAEVFSWIDWRQFPEEEDQNLKDQIEYQLLRLQCMYSNASQRCWTPFGLQCMLRYQNKLRYQNQKLNATQILEILHLVETFIVRRWCCGVQTSSFESFFAHLDQKIVTLNEPKAGSDYVSKLKWLMRDSEAQLPHDDQLNTAFQYGYFGSTRSPNSTVRNFILASFEEEYAQGKNERGKLYSDLLQLDGPKSTEYSLEHIMPQTLTDKWKADLGPNAELIHGHWLNRIANLTLLTPSSNSECSNRPFKEKCETEHGYQKNELYSNRAIAQHEHWGEAELKQRTEELYQMALKIWPYPTLDNNAES